MAIDDERQSLEFIGKTITQSLTEANYRWFNELHPVTSAVQSALPILLRDEAINEPHLGGIATLTRRRVVDVMLMRKKHHQGKELIVERELDDLLARLGDYAETDVVYAAVVFEAYHKPVAAVYVHAASRQVLGVFMLMET